MDHQEHYEGKAVLLDLGAVYTIYSDGSVNYSLREDFVPPSLDQETGVSSTDVTISPETRLSARIYLPETSSCDARMPIVLYARGGAGFVKSVFSFTYHNYLNVLAAKARVVAVAVEYREPTLDTAIEDTWAALTWVAYHAGGEGNPWLLEFGDMERISVMGDSSGAIIAHLMTTRAAQEALPAGIRINCSVIVHPHFWGSQMLPGEEELYEWFSSVTVAVCELHMPEFKGLDDPRVNPTGRASAPLEEMTCARLLVCSAEKDVLRSRAWNYYFKVGASGWGGVAEYWETYGEDHLFHLCDPNAEDADDMHHRIGDFINGKPPRQPHRRTPSFF